MSTCLKDMQFQPHSFYKEKPWLHMFPLKNMTVNHWMVFLWFYCRSNLKGLYRGDIFNVFNCQRNVRPSRPALVCWMGFTSYQAAFICLGETTDCSLRSFSWYFNYIKYIYSLRNVLNEFLLSVIMWLIYWHFVPHMSHYIFLACAGMVIQSLVFFICLLFAVFLVIIPILYGKNLLLFRIIGKMWWVSLWTMMMTTWHVT